MISHSGASPAHDHKRILSWAEGQLEGLEASITRYFEKNPTVMRHEHDAATGEVVVRYIKRRLPEEDTWAFQIGETVHNTRAALDYLAFRIVTKHPHLTKVEKIAFPICLDGTKYPSLEGRRIGKGVPDTIRDAIKGLQPYHRAEGLELEPLVLLDELENIHKHRRLLIAGLEVKSVMLDGTSPNIQITVANAPVGPLNNGTELYRYRVLNDSHAEDHVKVRIRSFICFDEGPFRRFPPSNN